MFTISLAACSAASSSDVRGPASGGRSSAVMMRPSSSSWLLSLSAAIVGAVLACHLLQESNSVDEHQGRCLASISTAKLQKTSQAVPERWHGVQPGGTLQMSG